MKGATMPPSRKFKKYANRKLYDITGARYVSMLDLALVVSAGEEVAVFDDRTGFDITFETLARALYEKIKNYYSTKAAKKSPPKDPFGRGALAKLIRQIPSIE